MQKAAKTLLFVAMMFASVIAYGEAEVDEREIEEARLQQVFRDGMATIVEDLNQGSFKRFVRAIDKQDMLDLIFGLRLIDQRIQRDFREDMKKSDDFENFISTTFKNEAKDGIRARLLTVESRGTRGRAVIRFDMSHFQANYIDYELRLDEKERLVIVDWDDYLWGHRFSDRTGLMFVQGQPNVNAVRKLIDYPNVREAEIFQVMEALKAARDFDFERYFGIFAKLDDKLKRQRAILVVGLDASKLARKRRNQRKLLEAVDQYYPKDPLFALSLLDYYFPDRQYQKAYDALTRLKNKLRVDDGVTNARLSAATLVMGQVEDALAFANKSVEQEPELELGWWAVLRAQVAAGNNAAAIASLDTLSTTFNHDLGPEALSKDPSLKEFARTAEYRGWHDKNAASDQG
ncbi:MAG: hypothetical protein KJO82_00800 [Gammaproteobacteria bacterium]|nr:hypothetical protein [Gammaproteobacteria bacterium]